MTPTKKDATPLLMAWTKYCVSIRNHFRYEQIRPMPLKLNPFPVVTDCSGFVTLVCKLAGLPDPNGLNYNGRGYTGTLLSNKWNKKIPKAQAQAGDLVVYGPGTGWHVAMIVEGGPNPLTVSMGQNGDPSYVHVNEDGRMPQTYLRLDRRQLLEPTELPKA